MIHNYFKIAWRSLVKHKTFGFINISGLAIGIASCLILFTVINYELNYDKFQPGYKQIHRVLTLDKQGEEYFYTPGIPFPALDALRLDIQGVKTGSITASYGSQVTVLGADTAITSQDKKFIESTGFFFADPEFFEVFTYKFLSGSASVLKEPNVTVLTKKMAEKYFGSWEQAVDKYLLLDNLVTVKVAGILEDIPVHTDFPLAIITSFETMKVGNGRWFYTSSWGGITSNFQVYMLLPDNISRKTIDTQLQAFSTKHYTDRKRAIRENILQPLSEMHFDNRVETFGDHITEKSTLWTLALIGLLIIIMACINFINLSTAQAAGRSKEIGIRKVLGSSRKQLFGQLIGETVMIVIAAVLLSLAICFITLPFIKHIASIYEPLSIINFQTGTFLVAIVLLVTFLSGIYPALILSGFKPVLALKNKITSAYVGGISLRRGLVVTQFAISQVLIAGTIIAVTQMSFVRNADLGFAKDALLIINANTDSAAQARQKYFAAQLRQQPGVQSVSFSSDVPSSDNNWTINFAFDHKEDEDFGLYLKFADEHFFNTYGLTVLAGRTFSPSDTLKEIMVNETLTKKLGLKDPAGAIGKEIRMGSDPWRTIVGVAKDFKTNSLKEDVKPTLIGQRREYYSVTAVKLKSSNNAQTQSQVEAEWNKVFPEYAYTTTYMDEQLTEFYKQDEQLALLYKIFAGIAIFISCLGLYGLVSFMAVQKTKEIGVRKVLGASVKNIIFLFSKEFTNLIIIASLIAIPVAYYFMDKWLQNFVFKISISPWVFVLSISVSIIVAWLAVGYKSIKAALANPVKNLRTE